MAVRLSALRACRPIPPGRFLIFISVRGWVDPQGHSAAGRIRSIEKSNNIFGNRTHDLLTCSIVAQQTILPRVCMYMRDYVAIFTAQLERERTCSLSRVSSIGCATLLHIHNMNFWNDYQEINSHALFDRYVSIQLLYDCGTGYRSI
jgi:hypothetical protein